jgi:hypothetical protein
MGQYEYISSNGDIKVKNVAMYFDKKKQSVIFTFDYKLGVDIGGVPAAYLYTNGTSASNRELLETLWSGVNHKWQSKKITHDLGSDTGGTSEWALKDYGTKVFTIILSEEATFASGQYVQIDFDIDIDLDPVEHHLTYENINFGGDSTPNIQWSLTDLPQETFMNVPTLTVTESGATATTLKVYFENISPVSGLTGGIVNLNGIAIKDSSVPFSSTKTYFDKITKYEITSPAMVEGLNNFTIDLKCEVI